jgi:hypothetical protein
MSSIPDPTAINKNAGTGDADFAKTRPIQTLEG